MKTATFILLFIIGSLDLCSQTTKPDSGFQVQNQVGIDATNFIKTFISLSTTAPAVTENVPVFMLNYKCLFSNFILPSNVKYGLRIGANYTNTKKDVSTETTFDNSTSTNLAWRAGIELQQQINKHWIFYYGIDYLNAHITDERKTKINEFSSSNPVYVTSSTTNSTKLNGFGPIIGIQFNLNKYLCLSTETSLYFISGSSTQETTQVSSDPSRISVTNQPPSETTIKQSTIALPAFINFSFMF